jgi:hypothetical protein
MLRDLQGAELPGSSPVQGSSENLPLQPVFIDSTFRPCYIAEDSTETRLLLS